MSAKRRPKQPDRLIPPWLVLTMAVMGLGIAISLLPTTIVVTIGLLPSFVAFIVDRDPGRNAGITVMSLNLCGITPTLLDLWTGQGGQTIHSALSMLAHPWPWVMMYGAAAIGWGVQFTLPPMIGAAVAIGAFARARDLEHKQEALAKDWGPEVTGFNATEAQPA